MSNFVDAPKELALYETQLHLPMNHTAYKDLLERVWASESPIGPWVINDESGVTVARLHPHTFSYDTESSIAKIDCCVLKRDDD